MSFNSKVITLLATAGAFALFSVAVSAQDKPATPQSDKAEKVQKGDKEFGRGRFGKQGMGPGRMGMRMGMRGGGMMGMFRGLDLTDAQKTQIQSILAANRPKPTDANREEMRTLMLARRTGTLTTAQEDRLKAIRSGAQEKAKAVHEQLLGVLTAEQKATLEQRRKNMMDRMQQRRQRTEQKTPPSKTN